MTNTKLLKGYSQTALLALTAILLTSCGSSPSAENANSTVAPNASGTPAGGTAVTPIPTPTPSPTPTTTGQYPPITSSFTVTGAGGTNPSYSVNVTTDNLLKIKVTAGAATNVIPNSNFSATYGCVTYKVSALGQSMTTQTLSVNGGNSICPNAPATQTLDFSGRLTAGHQSVAITVEAGNYDFYCQSCLTYPWLFNAYPYGYYSCSMYCPLKTVFKNHGLTGTLDIQVNGTSL